MTANNELTRRNNVKDQMWGFLMKFGQEPNIESLKIYVNDLITMTTQKTAGQRKGDESKGYINWDELDMTLMSIVIEATALVLSGRLDELEERENG